MVQPFEDFYVENLARVVGACSGFAGASDARDIAQEAFARTWASWEKVSGYKSPLAFTLRVASNLAKNRTRDSHDVASSLRTRTGTDGTVEVETRMVVQSALLALPRRQRECLVLSDLLGFDSREIGRVLRIRSSTVRVHVTRGRAALRESLGDLRNGSSGHRNTKREVRNGSAW